MEHSHSLGDHHQGNIRGVGSLDGTRNQQYDMGMGLSGNAKYQNATKYPKMALSRVNMWFFKQEILGQLQYPLSFGAVILGPFKAIWRGLHQLEI